MAAPYLPFRRPQPSEKLTWTKLLTGINGRIDRRTFWLRYYIPLNVISIGIYFAISSQSEVTLYEYSLFMGLGFALFTVPGYIKRLHDRNRPGWLVAFPILFVVQQFGMVFILYPNIAAAADGNQAEQFRGFLYELPALALSIWVKIETYFLAGTDGPNRYGEAPLEFPD